MKKPLDSIFTMKMHSFPLMFSILSLIILGCETTPKEKANTDAGQRAEKENAPVVAAQQPSAGETTAPVVSNEKVAASTSTETVSADKTKPSINGKIVILDSKKTFVIVDFQNGITPPLGSELGVYRYNQFVGSIRITKPLNERFAAADILKGTLQRGDVVR